MKFSSADYAVFDLLQHLIFSFLFLEQLQQIHSKPRCTSPSDKCPKNCICTEIFSKATRKKKQNLLFCKTESESCHKLSSQHLFWFGICFNSNRSRHLMWIFLKNVKTEFFLFTSKKNYWIFLSPFSILINYTWWTVLDERSIRSQNICQQTP